MIFTCPGTKQIPIYSGKGCLSRGVYSVLIKPSGGAVRRGANGHFPHILYRVTDGGLTWQNNSAADQGTFSNTTDRYQEVEFDGGTFSINNEGSLYLTGGDPAGKVEVRIAKLEQQVPVQHPHRLTALVANGADYVIPDYHEQIQVWTSAAGATLESVPITSPACTQGCIPGTTFANRTGASVMVVTYWIG